jgi:GGDEF domain-containing protein
MPESKVTKQEFARFGRILSLLFNRATMYQMDHPYVKQSIDEFHPFVEKLLTSISPLVFAMNREQFFTDDEPLDPRITVNRMVAHFKKAEIQSISFYEGMTKNELKTFLGIFVSLDKYPNAESMKETLAEKGITNLRINHVFYKKVTEDDEVVSRDVLKNITPEMMDEDELKSKKLFIDMVLESVLGEEFEKNLNINNLLTNPTGLSMNMIEADINSVQKSDAEDRRPGPVLLHQLQVIGEEVEKGLSGGGGANVSELAAAVFDMKKKLIEGMDAQKDVDITFSNKEEILDQANEITDNVLIRLVKNEYKAGKISTSRLAQILRRLIPEAEELKRVLPKIKAALLEEGMPLPEYLNLVEELGKELQSDELAKILQESSEEIGIDGKELIQEVKENPVEAAELICLAAEIRKGTGDEKVLTDLLVDYVERMGSKLGQDITAENGAEGEQHLRQVITGLETNIVSRLKDMNVVKDDVLEGLEERLNKRMDTVFDKLRDDWIQSKSMTPEQNRAKNLSVLQILEQSVGENEELGEILTIVRSKVKSEEIDENDFKEIYSEINKQKQIKREQEAKKKMPPGVLKSQAIIFVIKKEISRASRYDLPFSALSFSVVKAKPKTGEPADAITQQAVMDAILRRLADILREADIIGQLGKNKMVGLLPMTTQDDAKLALRRTVRLLHGDPIEVDGIPLTVKIVGVSTTFDAERMTDGKAFMQAMSNELTEMVIRVKNIQELF